METVLARASLYNFLAAAFGDPPTAELLATLAGMVPEVESAPLDELRRAYTQTLVGPGRGYVPPYASIHLHPPENGKPQLWGPEAVKVDALYREAGLLIAPGQPQIPDHLALELQFMQHLCARQANAASQGDAKEAEMWRKKQQVFLCEHLSPWLPRFAARLSEAGAHPVYRALADFTLAFVRSESEMLSD